MSALNFRNPPHAAHPLGMRDSHGQAVKTSPPRTAAEQSAIDAFLKKRGVTRVKPFESGLPSAEEAAVQAKNIGLQKQMDERVKKMLRHILKNGPQKADALAIVAGYAGGRSVHDAFRVERFAGMVKRGEDFRYTVTATGKGFAT